MAAGASDDYATDSRRGGPIFWKGETRLGIQGK